MKQRTVDEIMIQELAKLHGQEGDSGMGTILALAQRRTDLSHVGQQWSSLWTCHN